MSPGQTGALLAAWLVGGCLAGACTANGEGKKPPPQSTVTDPSAQDYQGPPLPRGKVILQDAYGGAHLVEVEIAATEPARTRGLMWRTSLRDGEGMLFVFPTQRHQSFWMRNTLIPLDIVFIDEDLRIVGFAEQAEPQTLTSRAVPAPSKYVLEVPGGWMEQKGIRPGSRVKFEGVPVIPLQ
jgi:uncharacterized protein